MRKKIALIAEVFLTQATIKALEEVCNLTVGSCGKSGPWPDVGKVIANHAFSFKYIYWFLYS